MRNGKKKGKKWLKITSAVLAILLIAIGVYVYFVYHSVMTAVETMHQPIRRTVEVKRDKPVVLEKKTPFSILLLGVDQQPHDKGRSDTIIVLAVNPNNNSVKMLSIPRDTRTEIVGKGTVDKINHAYAFGGVAMSMNTVEKFLDIPIDYYMKINMEGFKDIVNAVGGVTVQNDLDFTEGGYHFPIGEVKLDGAKALEFSRMRYEDPRGDFGRNSRQRKIIQAVLKEGTSIKTLATYSDILKAIGVNVKTNLTFNQMVDIQKNYKGAASNIQQMEIKETGTMINKIYYGIVAADEQTRIQNELKAQLELSNQ